MCAGGTAACGPQRAILLCQAFRTAFRMLGAPVASTGTTLTRTPRVDETEPAEGSGRAGAARPHLSRALERAIAEARDEAATPRRDDPDRRQASSIIRQIVRQAQADGLRAEELVIAFRRVWNALAPAFPARLEVRADTSVSALITAFYKDQGTPSA